MGISSKIHLNVFVNSMNIIVACTMCWVFFDTWDILENKLIKICPIETYNWKRQIMKNTLISCILSALEYPKPILRFEDLLGGLTRLSI